MLVEYSQADDATIWILRYKINRGSKWFSV